MKATLAMLAGALALASCRAPGPSTGGSAESVEVRTREDLDRFSGKDVAIEGKFDHIAARHGSVTLQSGLVIYVPHFDQFRRGDDWLKYVGRQVRVEGILHTETGGTAGLNGPVIDLRRFELVDLTE